MIRAWVGLFRYHAQRLARDDRGQAAMVMVIIIAFMFFVGLIGINVTTVMASRNSAQRAADASALAGCLDLNGLPSGNTTAEARAIKYAEQADYNNHVGFTEGGNFGTNVTFSISGAIPNKFDRITVVTQRDQPLIGWGGFGIMERNVKAKAVCTRQEGFQPILHCLSTDKFCFEMPSQGRLIWPTGGIVVGATPCSANDQMHVVGGAIINVRHIDVCSGPAGCGENCSAGNSVQPWPVNEFYLADPFASVPAPTPPMRVVSNKVTCEAVGGTWNGNGPCEITGYAPAAVYSGGLRLVGKVTLDDNAVYYVSRNNQHGLEIGEGAEVTGTGVLFYNGMSGGSCGDIYIQVNAIVKITPSTSGDQKDLMFFQARTCDKEMRVEAGVTIGLEDGPYGVIYVPKGRVFIGCNSCGPGEKGNDINARVVAYEIRLNGPVTFADIKIRSGSPWNGDVHLSE